MVPSGVRRELNPLQQGSAPATWAVGLVWDRGAGSHRAPAWPSKPRAPGSGLPAPSLSITSHQREEERGEETLETTQSKTRESRMRAVGGNTDTLQGYSSSVTARVRLLVGQDGGDVVDPDPSGHTRAVQPGHG